MSRNSVSEEFRINRLAVIKGDTVEGGSQMSQSHVDEKTGTMRCQEIVVKDQ